MGAGEAAVVKRTMPLRASMAWIFELPKIDMVRARRGLSPFALRRRYIINISECAGDSRTRVITYYESAERHGGGLYFLVADWNLKLAMSAAVKRPEPLERKECPAGLAKHPAQRTNSRSLGFQLHLITLFKDFRKRMCF
jgi:hypothetical protein